jgi:ribosomal-protein-alanine acetyltransferase
VLPNDSKKIPPGLPPDNRKQVRSFAPGDFAEVDAILKASRLTFVLPPRVPPDPIPALGTVAVFVCEVQKKIVGMIAWRSLGDEVEILDFAVHPNHRRQGNASFLLKNFIQYLSQSAAQKIFLEVRESNAAAIALYKKFGFQISGRRPNYYRDPEENALLMNLSLPG